MPSSPSPLATLELTAARSAPRALEPLLALLRRLAAGTALAELAASEAPQADSTLAMRLATVIARVFLDPAVRLQQADALRLAVAGRVVDDVHALAGFGHTDHILRALGATDTESLLRLGRQDKQALAKAWLLLSLDSELPIDMTALLKAPPALALMAAMSLIARKRITTDAGHERREALVSLAGRLEPVKLPLTVDHLVQILSAWMLCSYAEARDKHGIKPVLNRVLREWGMGIGLSDAELPSPRPRPERPTLLVAAEVMHSNHVQYRYFGQYLRQLRQRFRLVLLTEEGQADPHARALYDECHVFKREGSTAYFKRLADAIQAIGPDMIFWLSVGMRHWGPVLANFRLAPIQFAGLGHSASTFCETIDYYLTEEGYVGDPTLMSEQLVLLPDESLVFERSPHHETVAPVIREAASPLKVALPSNLLKLNPRFMGVLRRIQQQAGRPIQFNAFPNVSGQELEAARRLFARQLPGSTVHPTLAYNAYLEQLNACDLTLSPFPFGGLHSVVDSLRQGIPVVALEGLDLHARTDAMLLRRLGLPEWLIARDEEAYVAAALRIIDDDAQRVALSEQALALDVGSLLFGDATTPLRSEVVEAVWWMYQHHEAIKASGWKVFRAGGPQVQALPIPVGPGGDEHRGREEGPLGEAARGGTPQDSVPANQRVEPHSASGTDRPFWTVIVTSYKRSTWLKKCIETVISQNIGPDRMEVIVADDDPQSYLANDVAKWSAGRATYKRNPRNLGLFASINASIQCSRGKWIHIIADDDWIGPSFHASMEQAMSMVDEDFGAAVGHYFNYREETQALEPAQPLARGVSILGDAFRARLATINPLQIPAVVIRRESFEKVGLFREDLPYTGDWELWFRLAMQVSWLYVPDAVAYFRIHPGSQTRALLRTAQAAEDLRRTLDINQQRLPPELALRIMPSARARHARRLLRNAMATLDSILPEAAARYAREACGIDPEVITSQEFLVFLRHPSLTELRNQIRSAALGYGARN